MRAYIIAYNYGTSSIFSKSCADFKDDTIDAALKEAVNELKTKGFTPTFNVVDNQATVPMTPFINTKTDGCKWQFVEASHYHVNTVEGAIQTFKNHFVSGLSSIELRCPLQLWDHLSTHIRLTLNLLCKSRILFIRPPKICVSQMLLFTPLLTWAGRYV